MIFLLWTTLKSLEYKKYIHCLFVKNKRPIQKLYINVSHMIIRKKQQYRVFFKKYKIWMLFLSNLSHFWYRYQCTWYYELYLYVVQLLQFLRKFLVFPFFICSCFQPKVIFWQGGISRAWYISSQTLDAFLLECGGQPWPQISWVFCFF